MAYKVFTNGSTLQASELNENLMQQAVATFSNAAARTAAITSPVEGQLTYLIDVDRYEHWTGSSWVSPFGNTLIAASSFTTASVVTIDNLFTSDYDNYSITFDLTSSINTGIGAQLRQSGVTTSTNYYGAINGFNNSAGTTSNYVTNGTYVQVAIGHPSGWSASKLDLFNPKTAKQTSGNVALNFFDGTLLAYRFGSVYQNSTTDFDGITIFPAGGGTITGNINVYGLRK